jgi:uncharacterized protein YndB with AHSA1/START domain
MASSAAKKAKAPRMSDDAVKAKTGKVWNEWFSLLDKAGGKKMSHQEIVEVLNSKYNVGPWWGQMVTATYEQARGVRDKHEKPSGYEISVSRTVDVPLTMLYRSFANEKDRHAWLAEDGLKVRKATPNKNIRVTWKDGKTSLDISFAAKNANKSQIVVQHSKLPDAKTAEKMKGYWARALTRLKESLVG